MSWQINTRDIDRVRSFDEAAKVWADATPWRNEDASWRPLAERRATHKRLVKLSDERGYEVVLYQTAMVTYFADGSVKLRCHNSISSSAFAWCVKPPGCSPISKSRRMFWEVRTDEGTRFYREGREALVLVPTAQGNWRLTSTPDEVHEEVNDNAKRREVRKQIKPYADWHKLTERLTGRKVGVAWANGRVNTHDVLAAAEHFNDPEQYLHIANLGRPEVLTEALYHAAGGIYKAPVPHDRLPRNYA